MHGTELAGPFPDGQAGNCGAMFGLFARNADALGLGETYGIPVINPVPPDGLAGASFYTHHPPGLAWLTTLVQHLPGLDFETAARLVALLLSFGSAWIVADLTARLVRRRAGVAAGVLMLMLPAGWYYGLLVNYETITLFAGLYLLRMLVTGRGWAVVAGAVAGLSDWMALFPLLIGWGRAGRKWGLALGAALVCLAIPALLGGARSPSSTGETLAQALGASFLAPDFRTVPWLEAVAGHVWTLFGWCLPLAIIALPLLSRWGGDTRKTLQLLLAMGLFNVAVFAQHATGHEHYSLLFLPYVAMSSAALLFASRRTTALVPTLALVILVLLSWYTARGQGELRSQTFQADQAARFASTTTTDVIYLRPQGVSLVFLYNAERHVIAFGAASLEDARRQVSEYRRRFGEHDLPVQLFVVQGDEIPRWFRKLTPAGSREGFEFFLFPES